MQTLVTNGGTHDPAYYATHILDEFVPMPPNPSQDSVIKVFAVQNALRPLIEEAVAACRNHERAAWERLTGADREQLVDLFHYQKGQPSQTFAGPIHFHRYTNKVFAPDYWVDLCAHKIARAVCELSSGDKPSSNEMIERIYNVFTKWFGTVADVERQHSVSSRGIG